MTTKKTKTVTKSAKADDVEPEAKTVAPNRMWECALPASELEGHHKLKILLTGPSGGGKTTTAGMFKRPLFVPTELQSIPTIRAVNPGALVFHNSDGRPGLRDANDLQQFRAMIRDPELSKRCDAVILDSLTDCQRIIKDAYTKRQTSGRSTTDMDTWGSIIDLTARLAREVRDLETHVLITVLDEETEINGRMVHRPNVFGKKLPSDLAQYFNAVGFAHTKQMADGRIRFQTMFRGDGDKYIVKGLIGLDDIEPPEPQLWAAKVFGTEVPPDVAARVAEWHAMTQTTTGLESGDDLKPTTEGKDDEDDSMKGDDPFADVQ